MFGRRHDHLRHTLRDMATTACVTAEEKPRGLPGFDQGGGNLLIHDIHPGQPIVVDWSVASEIVDALAETATNHAEYAAEVAERRKRQKKRPACDQLPRLDAPVHRDLGRTWVRPASSHSALQSGGTRNADRWHHLGSVILRNILALEDLCMP